MPTKISLQQQQKTSAQLTTSSIITSDMMKNNDHDDDLMMKEKKRKARDASKRHQEKKKLMCHSFVSMEDVKSGKNAADSCSSCTAHVESPNESPKEMKLEGGVTGKRKAESQAQQFKPNALLKKKAENSDLTAEEKINPFSNRGATTRFDSFINHNALKKPQACAGLIHPNNEHQRTGIGSSSSESASFAHASKLPAFSRTPRAQMPFRSSNMALDSSTSDSSSSDDTSPATSPRPPASNRKFQTRMPFKSSGLKLDGSDSDSNSSASTSSGECVSKMPFKSSGLKLDSSVGGGNSSASTSSADCVSPEQPPLKKPKASETDPPSKAAAVSSASPAQSLGSNCSSPTLDNKSACGKLPPVKEIPLVASKEHCSSPAKQAIAELPRSPSNIAAAASPSSSKIGHPIGSQGPNLKCAPKAAAATILPNSSQKPAPTKRKKKPPTAAAAPTMQTGRSKALNNKTDDGAKED